MTQTTTQVGRAKLLHPDLAFDTDDGGTALHAALASMWSQVSNHLPSRWTGSLTLADQASASVTHNFNLAIGKLKLLFFEAGVMLTEAELAAAYEVTQTSVDVISIKNISGGSKTFNALIFAFKYNVVNSDLDSSFTTYTPVTISGSGSLTKNKSYISSLGTGTTQSLPAATGSRMPIYILNVGDGEITVNPQGGEFINALSTLAVKKFNYVMLRDVASGVWAIEVSTGGASGGFNSYKASASQAVVKGDRVLADSSGGSFNLTLPASATVGDEINLVDYKLGFGANKVVLLRNGLNIMGAAENFDCDVSGKIYAIIYVDATWGWTVI